MLDYSQLRREVIRQIQNGNHQSTAIAAALHAPHNAVLHVLSVLAGEDWFRLDNEIGDTVGISDIRPGFQNLV